MESGAGIDFSGVRAKKHPTVFITFICSGHFGLGHKPLSGKGLPKTLFIEPEIMQSIKRGL